MGPGPQPFPRQTPTSAWIPLNKQKVVIKIDAIIILSLTDYWALNTLALSFYILLMISMWFPFFRFFLGIVFAIAGDWWFECSLFNAWKIPNRIKLFLMSCHLGKHMSFFKMTMTHSRMMIDEPSVEDKFIYPLFILDFSDCKTKHVNKNSIFFIHFSLLVC